MATSAERPMISPARIASIRRYLLRHLHQRTTEELVRDDPRTIEFLERDLVRRHMRPQGGLSTEDQQRSDQELLDGVTARAESQRLHEVHVAQTREEAITPHVNCRSNARGSRSAHVTPRRGRAEMSVSARSESRERIS